MVEVEILGEEDNSKKTSLDSPPTEAATTGDTSTYIYNDGDDNKEVPKDVPTSKSIHLSQSFLKMPSKI